MNLLRKQLEDSHFENALSYIRSNAHGLKHLNSSELARLNQMITSKETDPWRSEAQTLVLGSGRRADFSIISNPVVSVRNLISSARELASDGSVLEAATFLYSQLVMNHFFQDANRRSAVAAVYWVVRERGFDLNAKELLNEKLGDLHEEGEIRRLKTVIKSYLKPLE